MVRECHAAIPVARTVCCGSILSLVQILFLFFPTHYHRITITKAKEIKFEPRIKLNHNIHTSDEKSSFFFTTMKLMALNNNSTSDANVHVYAYNYLEWSLAWQKVLDAIKQSFSTMW